MHKHSKHLTPITAFAVLALAATPSYAAMDLVQGAITLGTALLTIFGVIVLVTGGYKAYTLMLDHHQVMPTIVGMLFAVGLCFGGAWWLTTLGAGTGAPAVNL